MKHFLSLLRGFQKQGINGTQLPFMMLSFLRDGGFCSLSKEIGGFGIVLAIGLSLPHSLDFCGGWPEVETSQWGLSAGLWNTAFWSHHSLSLSRAQRLFKWLWFIIAHWVLKWSSVRPVGEEGPQDLAFSAGAFAGQLFRPCLTFHMDMYGNGRQWSGDEEEAVLEPSLSSARL